jgi:hypothetical protein
MTPTDCDRYATLIVERLLFGPNNENMKKDISETIEAIAALARAEAMLEVAEEMKKIGAVNGATWVLDLARKAGEDVKKIQTRIRGLS